MTVAKSPRMNAQTLNCYSCGAAVTSDAPNCSHCGARLASISCPACFGMMFQGAKFCPHCGSHAAEWQASKSNLQCPSCQVRMLQGELRGIPLHECAKCFGIWLGAATFERVCRDAESQAAILGAAQQMAGNSPLGPVRYVRCPQCRELMHRMNFARCSGVIVDVCREHGTWFEANELHRIVHFIRAGGMERARASEKAELAEERRRIQAARRGNEPFASPQAPVYERDLLSMVIRASGDLFTTWLKH